MEYIEDKAIKEVLRKNVKDERLKAKMTQDKLSEKVNISTELLKAIERGERLGSITTFVNLCTALNVTPNLILYELFSTQEKEDEKLILKINKLSKRDKEIVKNLIDNMLK